MKTLLRNSNHFLITITIAFILILMEGCGVVTNTTVVDTKEIPSSKKVTKTILEFEKTQLPSVIDANIKLQLLSAKESIIATRSLVRKDRKPSEFSEAFFWGFPIGVGIGLNLIPGITNDVGNRIIGTILATGMAFLFSSLPKVIGKASFNKWHDGAPKIIKEKPIPIIEQSVYISYSGKNINLKTDKYGIVTFNPLTDFKIDYSTNNLPKEFLISCPTTNTGSKLEVKPSLWLNHFAKIKVPYANISGNKTSDYPLIGIARKGLEYKIIDEDNKISKLKIELFKNKYGWLKSGDVETFYSDKITTDIAVAIKNYVEERMSIWQMQGEFEGSDEYSKRMVTREAQLKDLTFEAMDLFQNDYINMISWKDATISRYDPNSQTFKIAIPELNEFVLHVPIEIAPGFKDNWYNKEFKNQKFILVDGNWELSSLEIKEPGLKNSIVYNSNLSFSYNPVNQFNFNLDPIRFNLSDINEFDDLAAIKYDIRTNLPKTKMSNPDAVAVVIGNVNYKYASNVDYAINDAQLVKTYLVNVLGYSPGNVLFYKNASKAEFEGIFGTKENYKGKLNNYVKKGISDVIVFYSGHGAPGLNDHKGYFVPVDCDPSYIELQGYNSDILYENLSKISAKTVTVITDACFSGIDIIKNISSIIPEVHQPIFKITNGSLLSSSSGNQVSSWLKQQQHGLFTYFFLKAIHDFKNSDINKDNKLTISEIFKHVSDSSNGVPYFARRLNAKEQVPNLVGDREKILIEF